MHKQDFRHFIAKHPALNLSALANEMDIARVHMSKIVAGLRTIPKAKCGRFLLIAQKYGYPAESPNNLPAFKTPAAHPEISIILRPNNQYTDNR